MGAVKTVAKSYDLVFYTRMTSPSDLRQMREHKYLQTYCTGVIEFALIKRYREPSTTLRMTVSREILPKKTVSSGRKSDVSRDCKRKLSLCYSY